MKDRAQDKQKKKGGAGRGERIQEDKEIMLRTNGN